MKRNEKVKVIKKRDPSRSLISAMEILIEMYPERAERILAKVRRERREVSVAKTQGVVV